MVDGLKAYSVACTVTSFTGSVVDPPAGGGVGVGVDWGGGVLLTGFGEGALAGGGVGEGAEIGLGDGFGAGAGLGPTETVGPATGEIVPSEGADTCGARMNTI